MIQKKKSKEKKEKKSKARSGIKNFKKNSSEENIYDTIIIGAGIAGCTAAIYASRKRMNFSLLTDRFGVQFLVS